jgi:hypothetical protein
VILSTPFLLSHCIIAGSWLFPGSTLAGRRNMRLEGEAHHVERAFRMIRPQDPTRGSLVASGEDACVHLRWWIPSTGEASNRLSFSRWPSHERLVGFPHGVQHHADLACDRDSGSFETETLHEP